MSGGPESQAAREAFKQGASSEILGAKISPTTAAGMAIMGSGGVKSADEEARHRSEIAANLAREEEERRKMRKLYEDTLGRVPFVEGGEVEGGGTTGPMNSPRMVTGAGDGMSDNVPASIEGVQEARLADGEFVIPADVVADIGNGSSSAGARKLYQMMDRIRQARHGTTEQPPEVDTAQYMPA